MPIIEALEWLLMIREQEAEEYNNKRQDQLIDFKSIRLASQGIMGSNKELERAIDDHVNMLSQFMGKRGEAQEQKRKAEMQWDYDLIDRINKEQERG